MEICQFGAKLFHADLCSDGHIEMTNQICSFSQNIVTDILTAN